jgi:hypothetical protein
LRHRGNSFAKAMDARVKPAHDNLMMVSTPFRQTRIKQGNRRQGSRRQPRY